MFSRQKPRVSVGGQQVSFQPGDFLETRQVGTLLEIFSCVVKMLLEE